MVLDVTKSFIKNNMPHNKYVEESVIIKITGVLVDMLLELDSDTYSNHVVFEHIKKVIYVFVLIAIHGMLIAALLFYKKFCGDLGNIGFELNPYNPCVSKMIKLASNTQ